MIPVQYRLIAWLVTAALVVAGSFYSGHHWATTKAEAERAKLVDAQLKRLNDEIARGDKLTQKLAAAEGRIVVRTVEVIKHVPKVTTGRLCLDAAAVELLQPGDTRLGNETSRAPVAEDAPDLAATDRDVAFWIATANQQYETCAGRVNGLVEWFEAN